MVKLKGLDLQYVTDQHGRKVSVLLPVEQFDQLVEDLQDLAAVAEWREEPAVSHEDLVKELKRYRTASALETIA